MNNTATNATLIGHQINGAYNASASSLYLTCPLTVDEVTTVSGVNWARLHYTGTGSISCSMYSMNGNGTVRQTVNGNRVGTGWIIFPNISSDDYWGTYAVRCYVPTRGTINTIHISERL